MKRPHLINFISVKNKIDISIKASISDSLNQSTLLNESTPFKSIALIKKNSFRVKLIGINSKKEIIYQKEYETDHYGNLEVKIALKSIEKSIEMFHIYETSLIKGISFMLGTFYIQNINDNEKVLISDFDKTLCETKFSSLKEIYYSLNSPLNNFPSIDGSLKKVKKYIQQGYQPFILSASPHFYEKAITDWLYQNEVHTSNIFLKDYRDFFSISKNLLSIKDVKKQGFYKLNQLVKILSMTGIPKELVLFGDGFEADTLIYLTLYAILKDKEDSWTVWSSLRDNKVFKLTHRQHSLFLSKLYGLSEQAKKVQDFSFKIHIRCNQDIYKKTLNKKYNLKFIDKNTDLVNYYIA